MKPPFGDAQGIDTLWIDLLFRTEPCDDAPAETDVVDVERAGAERSLAAAIVEVAFISVGIDDDGVFLPPDVFKQAAHQAADALAAAHRGVKDEENAGAGLKASGRHNEVAPRTAPNVHRRYLHRVGRERRLGCVEKEDRRCPEHHNQDGEHTDESLEHGFAPPYLGLIRREDAMLT
jgi:hypothetical protein